MSNEAQRHRIVIMGAGKVGKTCILKRFLNNTFSDRYKETVEDLYQRDYNISRSLMKVDFIDTAGNLTFPAMRRLCISTANGFVLVYSITNQDTFEEVKIILSQIKKERTNFLEIPCVIVGAMTDMENWRQVEKFDALNWMCNEGFTGGFVETSAKEGEGVIDIFTLLFRQYKGISHFPGKLNLRRMSATALDDYEPVNEEWNSDLKNFNRSRSLVRRGSKGPKVKKAHPRNKNECRVS